MVTKQYKVGRDGLWNLLSNAGHGVQDEDRQRIATFWEELDQRVIDVANNNMTLVCTSLHLYLRRDGRFENILWLKFNNALVQHLLD